MDDGVRLSGDIYLPEGDGPFPTVLFRTPYVKSQLATGKEGRRWARDGYAYVTVDVRGRGDSEGDFTPYRNDATDGYQVIEWIASQSWSTGRVGTIGGSYCGRIQWLTALTQPPHLKAMIPLVSPSDPFVESPTGIYGPMNICWFHMTSGKTMQDLEDLDWMRIYEHLPLLTMDEAIGRQAPRWRESMAHQSLDDFWKELCYQTRMSEIDLPVLHISGWYDDEQIGTPLNYTLMTQNAPSEAARKSQRLLMGPWGHQVNTQQKIGEVDFGPDSLIDLHAYERRFFDRHLKGTPPETEDPPVRIFVMGKNAWRDERTWPLPDAQPTPFYLHSAGRANSRYGDGLLSDLPSGDQPRDSYRSDPMRPFPFITEPLSAQIGGPDDYAAVERRDDVLVYTSVALDRDIEVTGPISAVLFAETTGKDVDFAVKLLDVWPSGFAQRITDGLVRARFRHGMDRPEPVTPGEIMELNIDLWYTSLVFKKGHQIRLEIASHAFPKYDRNLQTGGDMATETHCQMADQTIYHDRHRPSRLILPVVMRKG